MRLMYEVWVRVGESAGPVTPSDGKPLETFGEAMSLAQDFIPKCHEVTIIEKRIARRIQGSLPPPEEKRPIEICTHTGCRFGQKVGNIHHPSCPKYLDEK